MNAKEHFNAAQEALRKAAENTNGSPAQKFTAKVYAARAQGHAALVDLLLRDPTLASATTVPELRPCTPRAIPRTCNGCGLDIGDATDDEVTAALNLQPLPDVRDECQVCRLNTARQTQGLPGHLSVVYDPEPDPPTP